MFNSGAALNVRDSVIRGFGTGVAFQPTGSSALSVSSTLISRNGTGILFQNAATATGVLNDVQLINNGTGLFAQGANSTGPATVTIQNSVAASNSSVAILAGANSSVQVANSTIGNNATGLQTQSSSGLIQVTQSTVTANGTGWLTSNGGQLYSSSNNSIAGNTAGNTTPPTGPTTAPTTLAKNIVTDFGAKCDGVADDAPAFAAFNTLAKNQMLPVVLTIPSGSTCMFLSEGTGSAGKWFAKDIKKLLVMGYGATISTLGSGFFLGGRGIIQDNAHSARLATVAAGASSVQLLMASQTSLFKVGNWALLSGFDMMGYGYPPNPAFFEYVQITGVNPATGNVTFAVPLKNGYKSTWPLYWSGNAFEADQGGPATLYALDPSWDTEVEYRGLTISHGDYQTYANGRSITYRDATFTGTGCGVPTQNFLWQAINTNMTNCFIEIDKLVDTILFSGVTIRGAEFQSSSINLFSMDTSTIQQLNGTPKKAAITHSTIGNFRPGAFAYGRTEEIACDTCVINSINPLGITVTQVNTNYTMSGGVITIPGSQGPAAWAVPGANLMWSGAYQSETAFQIVDVTRDASNTYVRTSLSGGFPAVPYYQNTELNIRVHPAPKFTCIQCTGSADALDLSQAPAGSPIYSYSKRTYTGSLVGDAPAVTIWGKLVSLKMNVSVPYTALTPNVTMNPTGWFHDFTLKSDGSVQDYVPVIDLKTAGQRVVTPSGVTGQQANDSGLAVPEAVWFTGFIIPHMNTTISALPSTWPVITIEITTDQGVVIP